MVLALISDVHANPEALEKVFADIDRQGIRDVICLGDVVGYGPAPLEAADMVLDRCRVTVRGNHDEALLTGAYGFHPKAREAIDWTREQLRPGFFSGVNVRRRWEQLVNLPTTFEEGDYFFVHGSPRDPTSEYVIPKEVAFVPTKYEEIFATFSRYLFCGHSHLPCVVTEELEVKTSADVGNRFVLPEEGKAIINVGSVGQPRDGDPRACYVVVDGRNVEWRRVAYDVTRTVERFRGVEKLHPSLGERLLVGA